MNEEREMMTKCPSFLKTEEFPKMENFHCPRLNQNGQLPWNGALMISLEHVDFDGSEDSLSLYCLVIRTNKLTSLL